MASIVASATGRCSISPRRLAHHVDGHVDADHASLRPDLTRGEEGVESASAAEIEHRLSRKERRDGLRVAAPEAHVGAFRNAGEVGLRVAEAEARSRGGAATIGRAAHASFGFRDLAVVSAHGGSNFIGGTVGHDFSLLTCEGGGSRRRTQKIGPVTPFERGAGGKRRVRAVLPGVAHPCAAGKGVEIPAVAAVNATAPTPDRACAPIAFPCPDAFVLPAAQSWLRCRARGERPRSHHEPACAAGGEAPKRASAA